MFWVCLVCLCVGLVAGLAIGRLWYGAEKQRGPARTLNDRGVGDDGRGSGVPTVPKSRKPAPLQDVQSEQKSEQNRSGHHLEHRSQPGTRRVSGLDQVQLGIARKGLERIRDLLNRGSYVPPEQRAWFHDQARDTALDILETIGGPDHNPTRRTPS